MNPDQIAALDRSLGTLAAVLGGAALVLAGWRLRLRGTLGPARVTLRPGRTLRRVYLGLLALAAAAIVFANLGVPLAPALAVLALAALVAALSPGELDSELGEQGVQFGWHARRFAQLEEWRLTGDHLRWKLFGDWVATHAPAALHAELRERLTAANAERESRFQR